MAATHALAAPQVNQAFRPTGFRLAQPLDIAEGRRVGAGVVVGEGGVITQTHPQRQLDRDHNGRGDFAKPPQDSL